MTPNNEKASGAVPSQDAVKKVEEELEKSRKELATIKKEHEDYRTEKAKNDKMLQDEHNTLKSTMEKTR